MTNIHIADDLVIQILSRLPIKSLFRFKCVSKAWRSLISDYSFQARVLLTLSGLFYEIRTLHGVEYNFACLSNENSRGTGYIDTIPISLSFLPFYPHFEIVDCCNGLLLCTTKGPVFYVCNPLLKRWIALPNLQTKFRFLEATLVRHPEDSAHFRVFFQTGCSYRFRGPSQITFEVFDSAAGKWEIREAFFDEYLMLTQSPLLINEALHYACSPLRILRVNVKGWTCDAIDLPNTNRESEGTLLEFEGRLCYVCCHRDFHAVEDKLQIWMLKDWDTEDWVKVHEICNKVLVAKILEAGGSPIGKRRTRSEYTRPLAFGPGLGFALFTDQQRNIFSCDLQSMKVEKIFSLGEDDFDGTYRRLRIHPALSSPSSNTLEEARQQLQSTK